MENIDTTQNLQVLLKNPRGIQPYQVHSIKLEQGIEHAIEKDTSIIAITETNLDWNQTTHSEQCTHLIYMYYKHHKLISFTSKDNYLIL